MTRLMTTSFVQPRHPRARLDLPGGVSGHELEVALARLPAASEVTLGGRPLFDHELPGIYDCRGRGNRLAMNEIGRKDTLWLPA